MTAQTSRRLDFDGLAISYDERVLRPRPWTVAQSHWAAELLVDLSPGPVLELCSGAGHIGLAAVQHSDRRLVCVDVWPAAVELGRRNAVAAGLGDRVEHRLDRVDVALRAEETFPLIIADPPWVTRDQVPTYPEDPPLAIDGGDDGLDIARQCLHVVQQHLTDDGSALVQLGTVDQVAALLSYGDASVRCVETRQFDGGVVARLTRSTD